MSWRILIVDDESSNRLLLRTILEHDGCTVFEAVDGVMALEIARNERLDLMILDLSMPGMDGAALLKRLRADPAGSHLRVALYTATTSGKAMSDFLEANRIGFTIPKPSDPQTVSRIVREALSA